MTKWPVGLGDSGGCQGLPAHQLLTSDSQYVPHRRSTTSLIQALCDGTHGQGCIGLLTPWLPLRILVLLGNHIPTIRFQGKKGRRQNKEEKKRKRKHYLCNLQRGQVYIHSQGIPCENRKQCWERARGKQGLGRAGTGQMEQAVQPHSFS